jgi:hypothetical protein
VIALRIRILLSQQICELRYIGQVEMSFLEFNILSLMKRTIITRIVAYKLKIHFTALIKQEVEQANITTQKLTIIMPVAKIFIK